MATVIDKRNNPVIKDRKDFDARSGSWLERIIFNNRILVLIVCAAVSVFLCLHATKLRVNASFEAMLPQSHPFIKNYFSNVASLRTLGNSIRIVVENPQGDIFDKRFQEKVQKINDTVYLIPGVDRGWMRSIWTPNVRWTEVTEEGFKGGPVMPDGWNGSPQANAQLAANIARAGILGSYVADDYRSVLVVAPLLDKDPETGTPLDYGVFSRELEEKVRSFESDGTVKVRIVGFAKIVGDLIDGLKQVIGYFAISALIASLFVYFYTRCLRSTLLLVLTAGLGVAWLLGILQLCGYVLDPYSILAPFLVFAIGLSHGAQKMNGIMQDIGRGTDKYVAARYTFRRLFLAGLTALLTNVVGFAVLMLIDIPVIRDLAVTTSIGVLVLIFTKLVLIPVMLSYTGVSTSAAERSVAQEGRAPSGVWLLLERFTERRYAIGVLAMATLLTAISIVASTHLKIGDLDPGAAELRQDSRYNMDAAYLITHYRQSTDLFAVIFKTRPGDCDKFESLIEADRMAEHMRSTAGVQAVRSVADVVRIANAGTYEGNPKFASIPRNKQNAYIAVQSVRTENTELASADCDVLPIIAYLKDHKAETLSGVSKAVAEFASQHDTPERQFLMAAGGAGIEAATNLVVRDSIVQMYLAVYGAVALLCFVTFRNWRAVVVAIIPLVLTSILCKALMVWMGIGLKVATLPVIALGVGVGVDYALYLLSVQLAAQRSGMPLGLAYRQALHFTGKVVALVGLTMAAGVITWAWSPIKFQADMGILLTFMFLWNMIGALTMIPALSYFLLNSAPKRLSSGPLASRSMARSIAFPEGKPAGYSGPS